MSLVPVHDGRFMAAYILLTERQLTLKEVVALLLTRPCRSGRAGSDEGGVATSLVSNRRNWELPHVSWRRFKTWNWGGMLLYRGIPPLAADQ